MKNCNWNQIIGLSAVLFLVGTLLPAAASAKEHEAGPEAKQEEVLPIQKEADEALKAMGDYLQAIETMKITGEATYDLVLITGQKIQYVSQVDATVRKSDGIRAGIGGGVRENHMYYNGESFVIYEPVANYYVKVPVPGNLDAALDKLAAEYGFTAPLSDLALEDPYKSLISGATSGLYVGIATVDGVACHHLAFRQKELDWQIWIEADIDKPAPKKLVITYNQIPGAPQYSAVIRNLETGIALEDEEFEFTAPEGAREIEMMPLSEGMTPGTVSG